MIHRLIRRPGSPRAETGVRVGRIVLWITERTDAPVFSLPAFKPFFRILIGFLIRTGGKVMAAG